MEVADWLRALGLERYEATFRENDVSAAVLHSLTGEDLKELGVTSVGHRRQLLEAIAALRTEAVPLGGLASGLPVIGTSANDRIASTGERRPLSVMFCDVIDFTALSSA